jgi:DNA repair protein RadA/Sms
MAKQKTAFVCSECGSDYHKWQGQCSDCGAWNTLSEVRLGGGTGAGRVAARAGLCRCPGPGAAPRDIDTAEVDTHRYGHGRVRSRPRRRPRAGLRRSHGRQPGAGKSTLLLQACCHLAASMPALYVTGEESPEQVAMRAQRLDLPRIASS